MRGYACEQDFAAAEEAEILQEGLSAIENLEAQLSRWQLQRLLGGPYDEGDAVLSIQASICATEDRAACLNDHTVGHSQVCRVLRSFMWQDIVRSFAQFLVLLVGRRTF